MNFLLILNNPMDKNRLEWYNTVENTKRGKIWIQA